VALIGVILMHEAHIAVPDEILHDLPRDLVIREQLVVAHLAADRELAVCGPDKTRSKQSG
jgi:hypothetical protein